MGLSYFYFITQTQGLWQSMAATALFFLDQPRHSLSCHLSIKTVPEHPLPFPGDRLDFLALSHLLHLLCRLLHRDQVADVGALSTEDIVVKLLFPIDIGDTFLQFCHFFLQLLLLFDQHFLALWDGGWSLQA